MVQLVSSLVLLTGLIMHLMCELGTVKRFESLFTVANSPY